MCAFLPAQPETRDKNDASHDARELLCGACSLRDERIYIDDAVYAHALLLIVSGL